MSKTDVYLLSGFLGAGKTTLLKRLLAHPWEGRSAILVNEFGAVGIDGDEVRRHGGYDLVELSSGCVCCTLRGRFVESFKQLIGDVAPRRIFIEASGVSEPAQILEPLQTGELRSYLGNVSTATVVDATFFPKREVLGGFYERQIQEAQVILLNKTDRVDRKEVERIEAELEVLNPVAVTERTVSCDVEVEGLIKLLEAVDRDEVLGVIRKGVPAGDKPAFTTFSLDCTENVSRTRLEGFLEKRKKQVLRAKGLVSTSDGVFSVNFSSHGVDWEPSEPNPEACRLVLVLAEGSDPEQTQSELAELVGSEAVAGDNDNEATVAPDP